MLAVAALVVGVAFLRDMPQDEMRTLVFVTTVLSSLMLILANRTFSASLRSAVAAQNRVFQILAAAVAAALAAILLAPQLRSLFRFGALHVDDIVIAATAAGGAFLLLEGLKFAWPRRKTR